MHKHFYPFFWISLLLLGLLSSCSNSKQLAYFQDLTDTAHVQVVDLSPLEPLRLKPNDQVQITISSPVPEDAQFFNLIQASPSSSSVAGLPAAPSQSFANIYEVSPGGNITLPILGDLPVKGVSTEELKVKILGMLTPYLKDPIVSVRLTNFKVTVIGDVTRPMVVQVQGEQIDVLEALGVAGDMTVYGKRYNVKVLRKTENKMEVAHINFNTSKGIQSRYFQLRQNDVIYVEPNKTKGLLGEGWNMLVPVVVSILTLIVVLITNI